MTPVLRSGDYAGRRFDCDVLVVGTGAGGAVAGRTLAETRRGVIFMEEGPYPEPDFFSPDAGAMFASLYRDGGISPFLGRPAVAFAEGRCAGGGTTVNGGLLWRTPPWVLEEWREAGLPGYGEKDLAPHFEEIEKELAVRIEEPREGFDLDSDRLRRGAEVLGWRSVYVPRALKGCRKRNLCSTGCPTGAKRTMLETYLPAAMRAGARVLADCRARRIIHAGGVAREAAARVAGSGLEVRVRFKTLVLAGGALQTPHLIRRSGLGGFVPRPLRFHLNLKAVAEFDEPIHAEKGTMFTVQVQEHERDGMLFMASNLRPQYLATALSHLDAQALGRAFSAYDRLGLYAAMIRPKSVATLHSPFERGPLVRWRLEQEDVELARGALSRLCEILFAGGARRVYLPLSGSGPQDRLESAKRIVANLSPARLEMISVHAMSTCAMGTDAARSAVDPDGRLRGFSNVYVADASVLPSNTGESPQGTIMAFAREIAGRLALQPY